MSISQGAAALEVILATTADDDTDRITSQWNGLEMLGVCERLLLT